MRRLKFYGYWLLYVNVLFGIKLNYLRSDSNIATF